MIHKYCWQIKGLNYTKMHPFRQVQKVATIQLWKIEIIYVLFMMKYTTQYSLVPIISLMRIWIHYQIEFIISSNRVWQFYNIHIWILYLLISYNQSVCANLHCCNTVSSNMSCLFHERVPRRPFYCSRHEHF